MKSTITILLLLLTVQSRAEDTLDQALARAGFSRADLGWTPRGWWSRYPRTAPHKLDHFDDLFAEPLATTTFTRTMGLVAEKYLGAEGLAAEADRGAHSLYRLVYGLGVERRYGGFRSYSPNLTAEATPLDQAILTLYQYSGRQTQFVTFGDASPYPLIPEGLAAQSSELPADVSGVLGKLVLDIVDAHHWATLAFRKVSLEERVAVSKRLNLGAESVDALEYAPACDDVAKAWDEASLWYAGLKCVEALDTARRGLTGMDLPADLAFDWETPLGWIRIRGTGPDQLSGDDALLLVDLGGDDRYRGPVGASSPTRLLGLCLDLAGNDSYEGGKITQGAGMCGVGILLDVAGQDTYRATRYAQGVGQFGLGALLDLEGDDRYTARWSAQGCGYFGIGILADAAGQDRYEIHADGQGFGGPGGIGVIADRQGDDTYHAEPDPEISGRPSYHSELKVSVSNAQGCAMGRRGDGADGHSWAGGLGALIDIEGNDSYTAGNWSLGTGYWFGVGLVYEGDGNDVYRGSVWSQGSGAHFCIGVLMDEGGDDQHLMEHSSRTGLAFAHDFTIALLVNRGGDDRYQIEGDGVAFSINRSVAMLIDVGGDDSYESKAENVPGMARYDERFADYQALSTYFADASSTAVFLDIGGQDTYWCEGETVGNDKTWGDEPGSDNWKVRNVGVGMDVSSGTLDLRPQAVKGKQR